jgi:molecular chaperone GrpE
VSNSHENQNGQENTSGNTIDINSAEGSNQIEKLQQEVEKYKNDYLYLRAEFDNFRRNSIKERSDMSKYGSERIIVEVLGVLDNFERALQTKVSSENIQTYTKGVEMTAKELRAVLTKFGVTEVPCEGQPFDPSLHEALSAEETAAVEPGFVFRVFKKAFKLHDKLIRPAQVVVAKKPETAN